MNLNSAYSENNIANTNINTIVILLNGLARRNSVVWFHLNKMLSINSWEGQLLPTIDSFGFDLVFMIFKVSFVTGYSFLN